jgi:tetratricopeptide (TPR) repeat protein
MAKQFKPAYRMFQLKRASFYLGVACVLIAVLAFVASLAQRQGLVDHKGLTLIFQVFLTGLFIWLVSGVLVYIVLVCFVARACSSGNYDSSLYWHTHLFPYLEKHDGKRSILVAHALADHGVILLTKGLYKQAEEAFLRSYSIFDEFCTADNYVFNNLKCSYSSLLINVEQYDKAVDLLEEVGQSLERTGKSRGFLAILWANNLGVIHYRLKNYVQGKTFLEEALFLLSSKKIVPKFILVSVKGNLAKILRDSGELERADALYQECYEIAEKSKLLNHSGFVHHFAGHALLKKMMGDLDGAKKLYSHAIVCGEGKLSPEHKDLIKAKQEYQELLEGQAS